MSFLFPPNDYNYNSTTPHAHSHLNKGHDVPGILDNLLRFHKVGDVAVLIDAATEEPRARPLVRATCHQQPEERLAGNVDVVDGND